MTPTPPPRHRAAARVTRRSRPFPAAGRATLAWLAGALAGLPAAYAATLAGSAVVESGADGNAAGTAEAFLANASAAGTVTQLSVYLDAGSSASRVLLALYADAGGHPGSLLTQGAIAAPAASAWNAVAVPGAALTSGQPVWMVVLSPAGAGRVRFRDHPGGGASETSSATTLGNLPSAWSTGQRYADGPLSMTASSTGGNGPLLSVTPARLDFAAPVGGASPPAAALNVSNGGGGSLSFSVASNQPWLTASPASATAPAIASIRAATPGLAAGTYDGQLTLTAAGASGSPATIPVRLIVQPATNTAADWPLVGQNPARTSFAANDTLLDKTNIAGLTLAWSVALDGKVLAQPLFLADVPINGALHDVVLAASNQNSLYALDAETGAVLWNVNFGADVGASWPVPGGLGIRSAPAVERATNRVFVMSDDGRLRTLSLISGAALAPALQVIDLPVTNKVRGGLNLFAHRLYIATGSDGGDKSPWRGRVHAYDVSATTPALAATFDVIPGVAGDNRGGGIWSYGGVSVDPATGNVYAATGADWQAGYTPYGVRVVKLTPELGLVGSYAPPHPATFACDAAPCDIDFSATPTVFTPTGCPTLVAAGNKDGHLYVLRTSDFAATTPAWQALTLNTADDALKHGGVGGIPAFWPAGNRLFVTDSGDGAAGVPAGLVALSVAPAPACTLSVAWAKALPKLGSAQSSPTVVGNVVLVGEGGSGEVHAFDASSGAELWNSGTTVMGGTFAAPTVGRGKVFVGSWAGSAPSDYGVVRAFGLGTTTGVGCTGTPPAVLAGTQAVLDGVDSNATGLAEAFQVSAAGCGQAASLSVYLDPSSRAPAVVLGLYADAGGHPGMLLTQAALATPLAGAWNRLPVPPVNLVAARPYWIAVLGTGGGAAAVRDGAGGCRSETSASAHLATLPAAWATGEVYDTCPVSAYAAP